RGFFPFCLSFTVGLERLSSACGRFPRPATTNGPRSVQHPTSSRLVRLIMWAGILCAATGLRPNGAAAEALLVIEADSGKVLYAQNAGYPWYAASVTKLMTAYVTLRAVKVSRLTLDHPLTLSDKSRAQDVDNMA